MLKHRGLMSVAGLLAMKDDVMRLKQSNVPPINVKVIIGKVYNTIVKRRSSCCN